MKAIAIDDFAADPTMHDLPNPTPGAGEVLVRVEASSVNGMDLAVASGMVKGRMEYELPIVLGRDYGGTVEAIGPGVTGFEVGDPVFIPDLPENVNHGNDTQRHVFALESPALLLNIQLQDLDGKPIAKQAVVLKVDAKDKNGREAVEDVFELDTDKDGKFSQEILEDADIGELTVDDDKFVIFIGLLGPIGSNEGMRARLNNLGYFAGLANDTDTEQLRWALEEFQHDNKISPPNGDVDDPRNKVKLRTTQTKLGVIHGDRDVPT